MDDTRRSLDAMADHGWTRPMVMRQMRIEGAIWKWAERASGGEVVHLERRNSTQGSRLRSLFSPADEITVAFDRNGRLVTAHVERDHRFL